MLFSVILIPLIISIFLSINMGASGTAPSFASAYGAGLIRKDLIPGLFGIFVFLGVIFAGKKVGITIGEGIVKPDVLNYQAVTSVLLSITLSLFIANILGVPQSTSQSTILALMGVGVYRNSLIRDKLFTQIIPGWLIFPLVAFIVMLIAGKVILKYIAKSVWFDFGKIEKHIFIKIAVIIAACYSAFSIGANNVANASGPITSMILKEYNINNNQMSLLIMILSVFIMAPFFGIGSSILGIRNLETVGKKIIPFGPLGALLISAITGTLLLTASLMGLPASEVQLGTGAIIGLSVIKKGMTSFDNDAVKRIFVVWMISPTIAFVLSIVFLWLFDVINKFF